VVPVVSGGAPVVSAVVVVVPAVKPVDVVGALGVVGAVTVTTVEVGEGVATVVPPVVCVVNEAEGVVPKLLPPVADGAGAKVAGGVAIAGAMGTSEPGSVVPEPNVGVTGVVVRVGDGAPTTGAVCAAALGPTSAVSIETPAAEKNARPFIVRDPAFTDRC
jgi:hypothetical protein